MALVLFDEAQRFGAAPGRVRLARDAILPYTRATAAGEEVTVPMRPSRTPGLLGAVDVQTSRGGGDSLTADIDANVTGAVLGVGVASRMGLRRGQRLDELWLGARRLTTVSVRVDSTLQPDALRIGLDLLWALEPLFDERAGTLTLGRRATGGASQIPWLLTFPGLQLVPRVGEPPARIESAAGRALLRGRRWQIDPRQATIHVDG